MLSLKLQRYLTKSKDLLFQIGVLRKLKHTDRMGQTYYSYELIHKNVNTFLFLVIAITLILK